ncbi:FAD-binding oxidoreductase [Allorhizocola rhizosphaerae]|uniref:FAD-binding oxidoreductase n=1 Tax=Allorhizocola rhizosphaerae TaxID=1872709 RepID=UPI000E3BC037|nr:FAD-binding oxidoreductase [Allorhizocola rhizosphaerae]
MSSLSRRMLIAGAGSAAAGLATGIVASPAPAHDPGEIPPGPSTITPSDTRYPDAQLRGYNKRFVGTPEAVRIVGSTDHVIQAVREAVRAGKRIGVRSGGHCLEGLVDDPAVKVVIDFTEMRDIAFDPARNAFTIEPGATLGQIYRTLYYGWGVTIPGGVCPAVGAGGHIVGGGVGPLSRQFGLVADLLCAVEVVVVDAARNVKAIVATNNPADPNYDLWWAHTGGGGGNFGVVTKFWLRQPGVRSSVPTQLLPKAPGGYLVGRAIWNWPDMTAAMFRQLCANFGAWHEQNSAPGSPGAALYASLIAPRFEAGRILVSGQIDPGVSSQVALLDSFLAAVGANVGPQPLVVKTPVQPWLNPTISIPDTAVSLGITGPPRSKTKGGLLKKRYTDQQIDVAYHHLTRADYSHKASVFTLASYGGQINALASGATATAHRGSIMLGSVFSAWDVPADDQRHLDWTRAFYRDIYASTGGVPAPNDINEGTYINWPDVDLADPAFNSSGFSAQELYYGANLPRLRRIKARYDPYGVFQHTLSIRP